MHGVAVDSYWTKGSKGKNNFVFMFLDAMKKLPQLINQLHRKTLNAGQTYPFACDCSHHWSTNLVLVTVIVSFQLWHSDRTSKPQTCDTPSA